MTPPFVRGRFEELPSAPRVAHPYFEAEVLEPTVRAPGWPALRAHVRKMGEGPPLLLVHGLMTSSYSFRYVMGPLAERFTCYAPDLPSAGSTDGALDTPYDPVSMARWIGALSRELGIHGCAVLGNSMGGYLCMQLALEDPASMSHLLNLHSPGIVEPRLHALVLAFAVPGSRALFRRLVQRDPLRWVHRNVHYYDESLKSLEEAHAYGDVLATDRGVDGLRKYLTETMHPAPMKVFERRLLALREADQPFPVPLMLVYADTDPMVPPRIGRAMHAAVPSASMRWLSGASHFAHVDAPEAFLEVALPFLTG